MIKLTIKDMENLEAILEHVESNGYIRHTLLAKEMGITYRKMLEILDNFIKLKLVSKSTAGEKAASYSVLENNIPNYFHDWFYGRI